MSQVHSSTHKPQTRFERRIAELIAEPFGPPEELTPEQLKRMEERSPVQIADAEVHECGDSVSGEGE